MFGFGKSKLKKLETKHKKLLKEAFELSKIDRRKSDLKYEEAAEMEKEILALAH